MDEITVPRGPIVLLILDGWGVSSSWSGNAILQAKPRAFTELWQRSPHNVLQAFAPVEAAAGRVGSSDIGHASIGAGRLIHSDVTDVSLAIASGAFFQASALADTLANTNANHGALHLVGLVSAGGIHSHVDHLYGLLEAVRRAGLTNVFVHAVSDGVDVAEGESFEAIQTLVSRMEAAKLGQLATVSGRDVALDRSGNWAATRLAYRALLGRAPRTVPNYATLVELMAHEPERSFRPTGIQAPSSGQSVGAIHPGDTVIFWNTRADRIRQLVQAAADPSVLRVFGLIRREPLAGAQFVTLTDYHLDLPKIQLLFPTTQLPDTLSRIVADHGLKQAKVGSVDRTAHLTYFINGGHAEPFAGEERFFFPAGESARLVAQTRQLVAERSQALIVVNLDQVDRAAHSGNVGVTIEAVRAVDSALAELATITRDANGVLIVTADHGNAEQLRSDQTGHRHTSNNVPFILVPSSSPPVRASGTAVSLAPTTFADHRRSLADVAPTVLDLLRIAKPSTMTGTSLLPRLSGGTRGT